MCTHRMNLVFCLSCEPAVGTSYNWLIPENEKHTSVFWDLPNCQKQCSEVKKGAWEQTGYKQKSWEETLGNNSTVSTHAYESQIFSHMFQKRKRDSSFLAIKIWKLSVEVKGPEKSSLYIAHNPGEEKLTFYINHSLHMFVIFNRHTKVVPKQHNWRNLFCHRSCLVSEHNIHLKLFSIDEVCITTLSHRDSLVADEIWWHV